ncbi:MAG: HDIG domain-containing protein [Ilumatobacter fluminis]|uniref:HDIG domain-containing metalloprotein n=1 Tax=Ilumatobacter fluminis TaxID=467091 RepID=UPI0032EEDB2D
MLTTATVLSSDARRRLGDTLDRADPTDELFEMVDDGFFGYWIPEIVEMRMEQDPVHRHKDVLAHTVAVTASTPTQPRLRLAALLHDVGKPATRRFGPDGVTFRHHEAVGARITRRRLGDMGFDAGFVTDVARLVELSGRFKGYDRGWTDSAVRRYVVDAGPLLGDLNLLVRHDCTTRHARKAAALQASVDELESRIRRLAADDAEARRRPPLSGHEIMQLLDIAPGPEVGEAVSMLLAADRSIDRDEATRLVREWWAERAC